MHLLLTQRGESVTLSKVKGHATCEDVAKNRVTARDKHGNDGADSLATAAALLHSLPAHMVDDALRRKKVVKEVQLMMSEILAARHQHLALSASAGDGSSSCSSSTESSTSSFSERASVMSERGEPFSSSRSSFSSIQLAQLAIHNGSDHPT